MKQDKVVGKIYQTKDYTKFSFRLDNRPINDSNVINLMESIQHMGQKLPIKVDSNYVVTDGQHRLKACVNLQIPVDYIIDDNEMSTLEIAQLQSTTKSWNNRDYASSFASIPEGNDYRLYLSFADLYPAFSHGIIMMMLNNGAASGSGLEAAFKAGKFKIKSYTKAKNYAETIKQLSVYYAGFNKRGFASAIIVMMNNKDFSLERLLRKMPKRCKEIHDFSKTEDYLDTLQDIYNWKETKKVYFH